MIQMALRSLFFSKKNYKKLPSGGSQTPSVIHLGSTSLLTAFPNLDKFGNLFNFWIKSFPFSKIQDTCQPRPWLLILHFTVSLFHKKSLISKDFDDTIMCALRFGPTPPIKIPGCACYLINVFSYL